MFKTYYSVLAELINDTTENLRICGKFLGALVKLSSAGVVILFVLPRANPKSHTAVRGGG